MMTHLAKLFYLPCLLLTTGLEARASDALIIDGHNNHDWRRTTPVLEATLSLGDLFTVDVVTVGDPSRFALDLEGYEVVVSNYNGPGWPEETRQALDDFVRNGGGLVVVHAADNAFPEWPEYNRMIGVGGWGGRTEKDGPMLRYRDRTVVRDETPGPGGGHGRRHEFVVVTRAPDHPIVRGLPERWLHRADELYDKLRGPAEALTVVATAWSSPETGGTGEHEPILMTIAYGDGRVFHTTLGHDVVAMEGRGFQETLRRGAEWAATGAVTAPELSSEDLPAEHAASRTLSELATEVGWRPLVDGSLDGWVRRDGTAEYRWEDGVVVATTTDGSPNTFLCSPREYDDFELRFEVLLGDDALNSGVQIRSRAGLDEVEGPQVEVAANPDAGFVYGEGLDTGWLSDDRDPGRVAGAFRSGEWNQYRVRAQGGRICTWINGVPITDFDDAESGLRKGFIALQVHSVPSGQGPYQVNWRGLFVREL